MKQHINKAKLAALAIATAVLAACGGGGDDPAPVASKASFPLSTVAGNIATQTKTYQLRITESVTSAGKTTVYSGSGTYTITNTPATFEGVTATKKLYRSKGTVTTNGISGAYSFDDTTALYLGSEANPLGYTDSGTYCVTSNQVSLPANAAIGSSGTWYDLTSSIGTGTVTYSVEFAENGNPLFRVTTKTIGTQGQDRTTLTTYQMTLTGDVLRATPALRKPPALEREQSLILSSLLKTETLYFELQQKP
jgi:hypothetical protein